MKAFEPKPRKPKKAKTPRRPATAPFKPDVAVDALLVCIVDLDLRWPADESFKPVIDILASQLEFAKWRERERVSGVVSLTEARNLREGTKR